MILNIFTVTDYQRLVYNNSVILYLSRLRIGSPILAEGNMDVILGRVLEAVDDNIVLCVISDHGFGSFRRAVHMNSWLAQNGLMSLKKTSQDDEGDPLFKNVVWNKTQAYAVGFSSIYLNLKGREGREVVSPGTDT